MKTKIKIVIAIVVAAVAAFVALNWRGKTPGDAAGDVGRKPGGKGRRSYLVQKNAEVSAVKYLPAASDNGGKKRKGNSTRLVFKGDDDGIFRDSDGVPYNSADQEIMKAAAAAVENDDPDSVRALAEKALASGNRDLRAEVVDALGWFGVDAMAELTPFMSDPDEEVAEAAASHWKDALQEISDDGMKAGVVEVSLTSLKNKDMLEDVADELIGIDELAAVQAIANLMEGGNALASDAARNAYESITGEEWTDVDSAEMWLQENYTPPDEDDE